MIKLSRRWPFDVAIFAVAHWRIFIALIVIDKAAVVVAFAQAKTGNL